jgi:hypothetical protein
VPAGPSWELLDDLIVRGWPKAWLSRELGGDGRALQLSRTEISARNAAAVADLHAQIGDWPRRRAAEASRTRDSATCSTTRAPARGPGRDPA